MSGRRRVWPRSWQPRVWTQTHADTMARLVGKCPYCGGADGKHGQIRDHGGGMMPCPLGEFTERAKPRASPEGDEHAALRAYIDTRWWRHGVSRPEAQARRGYAEAAKLRREGGQYVRSWPDWVVEIPGVWSAPFGQQRFVVCGVQRYAVELKPPEKRPKTEQPDEWWLEWARRDWSEWDIERNPTHYGLTLGQARQLARMDRCEWRTMVAYSADEAIAWLDEQCGPEPAGRVEWV